MARESWFRLVMDAEPGVRMPGLESVTGFRVYGRESRVLGLEWGGGVGSRIRIHLIEWPLLGILVIGLGVAVGSTDPESGSRHLGAWFSGRGTWG